MAHRDVLFPEKVSRGASISPLYNTTVNQAGNGREVRNVEWSRGLLVAEINVVLKDKPTIEDLLSFYRAVAKGAGYSFNFRDPSDLSAGIDLSTGVETAHNFEVGTGAQTIFPIYKVYTYGAYTEERRIQKPITPIKVYVNDVEQTVTTDYTVNYSTGKITFVVAPGIGDDVGWSGEFATPMRFAEDKLSFNMEATSAEFGATLMEVLLPDA